MEQNRPDEAINYYEEAAKKSEINNLNAKSLYNLGNAYYQKKDFEKSVNAFKQSLKLEPADMDTKKPDTGHQAADQTTAAATTAAAKPR